MSDEENPFAALNEPNAFASLLPKWIDLHTAVAYAVKRHGVQPGLFADDLVWHIKKEQIRHLLSGSLPIEEDMPAGVSYGLLYNYDQVREKGYQNERVICVSDWEMVEVDWPTCTVGGFGGTEDQQRRKIIIQSADLDVWIPVFPSFAKKVAPKPNPAGEAREVARFDPASAAKAGKPGERPRRKLPFRDEVVAAWFTLRVLAHPKDEAPPTEDDCLAEAREAFDLVVPAKLSEIRRDKTPESWRKRGPRGPRAR